MILEYPQNLVGTFSTSRAFWFFSAVRMGAGRHFSWSCREPSRPFGNRKSHRKTTTIIICSPQKLYWALHEIYFFNKSIHFLAGWTLSPWHRQKGIQNPCKTPATNHLISYPSPTHCCNMMWEKHVCRYRKKLVYHIHVVPSPMQLLMWIFSILKLYLSWGQFWPRESIAVSSYSCPSC